MKYLKTFENFNTPNQDESLNANEDSIVDDESVHQLKSKEEQDEEEREAIERISNGFVSVVIPMNDDILLHCSKT